MAIPSDFSNLALWLKADSLSASDGDPIGTWTDSSGSGNNATQATAANKPIYRTNIINGLPALEFGTAAPIGMSTPLSVNFPFTIFVVYKAKTVTASCRVIQGGNNWLVGPRSDRGGRHSWYNSQWIDGYCYGQVPTDAVWMCVTNQAAGDAKLYVNGRYLVQNTSSSQANPSTIYLGASGPFDERFNGYVQEVFIYSRVISSSERQALDAYIAGRTAIADYSISTAPARTPVPTNPMPLAPGIDDCFEHFPLFYDGTSVPVANQVPFWGLNVLCTDGVVGVPYSQQWDLTASSQPTTFALQSGSLPSGLTLTNTGGSSGKLSGIPTTAGTYTFTLRATNVYGYADKLFTVTVEASSITLAPEWGDWTFANGVVGELYDREWKIVSPFTTTFSLLSGSLPTGLSLASLGSNNAHVVGTPTTAGTFVFTLRATNSQGQADKTFSIVIDALAGGGGGSSNYSWVS